MRYSFEVIVIGGGIIGCSIAYYLAKEKIDVAVLEAHEIGSKSTSAAAGMLGAHSEDTNSKTFFPFARSSQMAYLELQKELLELSGIDLELKKGGIFKLAYDEDEKLQLQSLLSKPSVTWYDLPSIKSKIPSISSNVLGAAYIEDDVNVLPISACQAFSVSAQKLGATVLENTHVIDVQKVTGKFLVKTENGNFEAKHVVVANGVWSSSFFKQLGLNHKLIPVKGECISVSSEKIELNHTLFHEHNYIVPRNNGKLVIGATMIHNDWEEKPSISGIETLIQTAKKMLPSISEMKVESFWAGLRPQTFDQNPFIGRHPEIDHLYFATGHFRNGILLAPATANMIKNLILGIDVKTDWIDAFKIDRQCEVKS